MISREKAKHFITTMKMSLRPKYYADLSERRAPEAFRYFLLCILMSFLFMAVIAIPKIISVRYDLEKDMIDIVELKFDAKLDTARPILIPRNSPMVTLDTSGTREVDTEFFLITNEKVHYNFPGRKGEINAEDFDFAENRNFSTNLLTNIIIFLIPSIFVVYYLIYLIKYLALIGITAALTFIGAKAVRNAIELKQAVVLSFYTSTIMILIEILTLPFPIVKKYLLIYSPYFGITFSIVAITAYLTLYVTSIRLVGNTTLRP